MDTSQVRMAAFMSLLLSPIYILAGLYGGVCTLFFSLPYTLAGLSMQHTHIGFFVGLMPWPVLMVWGLLGATSVAASTALLRRDASAAAAARVVACLEIGLSVLLGMFVVTFDGLLKDHLPIEVVVDALLASVAQSLFLLRAVRLLGGNLDAGAARNS